MHLQQSILYQKYIRMLGWQVVPVDGQAVFIKHIPFLGTLAKLQRPTKLPKFDQLAQFIKSHHIRRLAIEPEYNLSQNEFSKYIIKLQPIVTLNSSAFLPTKTILIDLTPSESEIFQNFSEAKRRAVRRALSHHVLIKESSDIHALIKIKNKSSGFLGFITTYGVKDLWQTFTAKNAAILLAYKTHNIHEPSTIYHESIAGLLLIFHDHTAYYWIAGATKTGKKLFAPTVLVWEALKLSRKRGMTKFDFVGSWDERLPKQNTEWLGFTKFKSGFGGVDVYYPEIQTVVAAHQKHKLYTKST